MALFDRYLPLYTIYDKTEDEPGSIDPMGTLGPAEGMAEVLFPGLTARMWRPRFLTFSALATLVADRVAEKTEDPQLWLEARLGFERLFVSAIVRQERKEKEDIMKIITRLVISIRQTPKPVIAALNGVTAGATANFALASDIVIASEDARLVENFINIGLVPDGGGTFLVPDLIGYHRAAEIFFTGKILSAQEAMDLGLYNRVVPKESVLESARELARELIQKPALTLAAGKRTINLETIPRLQAHLEKETDEQRILARSHDTPEGVMAFIEKREPNFTGK